MPGLLLLRVQQQDAVFSTNFKPQGLAQWLRRKDMLVALLPR